MKKTLIAVALAAMVSPLAAMASESNGIGYTYVQADYVYNDAAGDLGGHMDGYSLSGSYGFTDNFFAFVGWQQIDGTKNYYDSYFDDKLKLHSKNKGWNLGVGFNNAIGSRADWVTKLAYYRTHVSAKYDYYQFGECGLNACDGDYANGHVNGVWLTTGVLGKVTDKLSANAYLGYDMPSKHGGDDAFFADFGAVYSFNPTWGLHGGLTVGEGGQQYSLGVRASF